MPDLFPSIQPQSVQAEEGRPLYRETAWDFTAGRPVFQGGNPFIVTGAEAVRVWAYKALQTVRGRYEIYSRDFGCEAENLIGQNFSDELKRAEAVRYVREALEVNPYITEVSNTTVAFSGGRLEIEAKVETIYGEVAVHV